MRGAFRALVTEWQRVQGSSDHPPAGKKKMGAGEVVRTITPKSHDENKSLKRVKRKKNKREKDIPTRCACS